MEQNTLILLALLQLTGFTTCMKTVEITRTKQAATGAAPQSTWGVFLDIYRKEGLAGINKGVNAVAVRQATNWGSRYVSISLYSSAPIRTLRFGRVPGVV